MSDIFTPEKRSEIMSKIRGKNTKPELRLRKELFRNNLRYRLHCGKLPGKPDIVFPGKRVAVFCHGCFWHGHAGCFRMPQTNTAFWYDKISANMDRDNRNVRDLEDMGWTVIVAWECDIKKRLPDVVNMVREACGKGKA